MRLHRKVFKRVQLPQDCFGTPPCHPFQCFGGEKCPIAVPPKPSRVRKHSNVPVKSKLQHPPPRTYPGHLTPPPAREGGNLIILVFPRAGHLITSHKGWGI